MNEKTSNFGNADVSIIGGFLLNRVSQFLKKAGFSHFSSMIFAEQVKKQLLSLIVEMATVPWLFSKNTSFGNLGIFVS